ncbi:uncharacterized protein LOC133889417 [Phragmites australis]|uniref:uncharacterized protein LOC133889417 n=1 Tax=Phragmites australis TaxID=29695 RepID=UPI002D779B29|nr:uncharacterized protein LOC133889417 [Phragmites australis]
MSSQSSSSSPSGSPLTPGSPNSPLTRVAKVVTNPPPASQIQLINIKTHVPITLDLTEANYCQWSQFFIVIFGKSGLIDHIHGSIPAQGDSVYWVQNDFAIVSWFYAMISMEIPQIIQPRDDTSFSRWRSIRKLFRDNKATRDVYISNKFRRIY